MKTNTKIKMQLLSILLCFVMIVGFMPISALAVTEIHQANITITKPVGGENPDIYPVSSEPDKYFVDLDSWAWLTAGSATPIGAGSQFKALERYSLRVLFRAKLGYTFADDCVYTINGETTGCYGLNADEFRYIYWYAADPQNPTYTVSFDSNGGSGTMADVTGIFDKYVLPPSTFTAPAGKYFGGWSVGGYIKDPGESITVLSNTTVYADWRNIPSPGFTVTYNGGNDCGGSMDNENKTNFYGELTLPECGFTPPAGKKFACWQVGNNSWNPGDKIIINFDTTVSAIWADLPPQTTTYTLSFDANGGSGTMTALTGGTSYTLPECTFTAPAGKQFTGWNVFGYTQDAGTTVNLTNNFTATAVWEDILEITNISATVNGAEAGATAGTTTVTTSDSTYTVSILGWYDCDNVFNYGSATKLQSGDKFVGGKTYTVGVRFTPVGSNVLTNNVDATINGEDGKIGNFDGNSRDFYITVSIPATVIQNADVYVDPPINGSKLDYTIETTGTPPFTTEVRRWFKGGNAGVPGPEITDLNATVEPDTNYVLDFTIAPKDGYTLDNSTVVKVNGTTAIRVSTIYGTNIGVYRVMFTSPKIEIVNANAIITVPVAGANPTYTVTSSEQHIDNNSDGYCDVCEQVEYVTIEIPFTKVVEQTGEKLPGNKTFKFDIFDFGHSEAADHVEIVADTITTNGKGNFEGVLKLELTKKGYLDENYLDEGFYVKEVIETAEGWTYSTAVWYVVPNFNGVGWIFYVVEDGNVNLDEKDEMIFTNSYKANNPVIEEDEKQPTVQAPQTGDNNALFVLSIALLLSLAFLVFRKRISVK